MMSFDSGKLLRGRSVRCIIHSTAARMPLAVEQVSIQSDESQENDALSRLEADSYYIIQFLPALTNCCAPLLRRTPVLAAT